MLLTWAASNCIKPLPPCFLGTYKRSTSVFGWCCPWMVSSFLVFRSSFCSSSWCQLTIPKLYLSTGTYNDPIAWILLFAFNSVPKISINFLKYSLLLLLLLASRLLKYFWNNHMICCYFYSCNNTGNYFLPLFDASCFCSSNCSTLPSVYLADLSHSALWACNLPAYYFW